MPDFGDLRSVLHEPATKESWARFTLLIERFEWEALDAGLLNYIDEGVKRWPLSQRLAPTRWLEDLIQARDAKQLRWANHVRLPMTDRGLLGALPKREELRWITRLSAWAWPNINELHDLLSSKHLIEGLRALDLSHTQSIGDSFLDELMLGEIFANLEELILRDVQTNWIGTQSIARSWPLRLHTLSLAANPLGERGTRALIDRERWYGDQAPEALINLDLRATGLDDTIVKIMVQQPWLDGLKSLQLSDNPITRAGIELIIGHEPWQRSLRQLSLDGLEVQDEGARLIAQTPWRSIQELTLWRSGVGALGAQALSQSPHLPEALKAQWRAVHG